QEKENPWQVDLEWCDFFVHMHNLAIGQMNREVAIFIGNHLRRFLDLDLDRDRSSWGSFLRIRVSLNIKRYLCRALTLHTTDRDDPIITFAYERLPNFCYLCGCLGHLA
ncbi:UNVERIFIED_CONTAM: hypothetical protein Sangu_2244600, partial [Sesamum angustifolium]